MTPDWTKEFTIQTDASAINLGFFLMQKNNEGIDHPVAYGSRKLLPRERNYSTIEREALAIVTGIKHFRTYVEGTKFVVETDHDALTHLATLKDSHSQLARWALSLQSYQFQIRHCRGSVNANADSLSRDPYLYSRTEEGGVSENSLPEFLTASCRGAAGLPVWGGLPEWSFSDVVGRETGHRVYGQKLDGLIATWRINWWRLLIGCQGAAMMSVSERGQVREDWIYDGCVYW